MLDLVQVAAQVGSPAGPANPRVLNAAPRCPHSLVPSSRHRTQRTGAFFSYKASQGRLRSWEQRHSGILSLEATRIQPAHAPHAPGRWTQITAMSEGVGAVSGLSEAPLNQRLHDVSPQLEATAAAPQVAATASTAAAPASHAAAVTSEAAAAPGKSASVFHAPERYRVLEALLRGSIGGCGVIDGGLATELERRGANINDPLWSAKCLLEDDSADLVRQVHYDYYKSGADVSISASYQATIQGFVSRGFSEAQAESLLSRSVRLVIEARDQFWEQYQPQPGPQGVIQPGTSQAGSHSTAGMQLHGGRKARHKPLVAASVGSYGAYLADGSEYSGEYGPEMTLERLVEFHRRRVQVLAAAGPDILAFETIPSLLEAQALVRLLEEESLGVPAWISFNSKDGANVVRGDAFGDCVAAADACPHVVAVGINCTPPRFIQGLILAAREVSEKPLVVYPNSGETWDADRKEWVEATGVTDDDFTSFAPQWVEAGASLIGGCCRTTPHTISCIRRALKL